MPKHKDQRVGVFVDIQNMYYSAKQFYHTKVNFAHILSRAVAGRQLIRAIAYVIKADIKEEENFFEALEKIGYDVRSKDLQTFYGGAKKGDWDVGIAMDIMRMASKLDVIVLVSGDGDFKDLLEHVKALGCRAEVIAFKKTASSRILSEADEFIDLDKELDKVLIKDRYDNRKQEKFPIKKETFQGNKPNFQRKDFQMKKPVFQEFRQEPPSLIQKINMEQPDLFKKKTESITMPTAVKREEKEIITKETKQELPVIVPEKQEKTEESKKKPIKQKKEKQESMLKKVFSKVTKKK